MKLNYNKFYNALWWLLPLTLSLALFMVVTNPILYYFEFHKNLPPGYQLEHKGNFQWRWIDGDKFHSIQIYLTRHTAVAEAWNWHNWNLERSNKDKGWVLEPTNTIELESH